jgi:hypothetical protein
MRIETSLKYISKIGILLIGKIVKCQSMGNLLINAIHCVGSAGLDRQSCSCSESFGIVPTGKDDSENGKENIEEHIEAEMGCESFLIAWCVGRLENLCLVSNC